MLSNDLKKGMKVMLKNGWEAEIMDNRKGNIREALVHGDFDDYGSIYVWDISYVYVGEEEVRIELTQKQKTDRKLVKGWLS